MSRRAWIWAAAAGVAAFAALLAIYARGTVTAFLLACGIAYVLEPLIDALESRKIPRSLAILGVWLVLFGLAGALLFWMVPALVAQARGFASGLDLETIRQRLEPLLGGLTGSYAEFLMTARAKALEFLQEKGPSLLLPAFQTLGSVTAMIVHVVARFFEAVLAIVLSFYLLRDSHDLKRRAKEMIPARVRERTLQLLGEMDDVLRRFIRGQVLVCLILGALYSTGLLVLRTPLAIPIGMLSGFANLIPYAGFAFGMTLALLFSFLQHGSWVLALLTVLVFVLVQTLEGTIISPRILGQSTGLHPVVVLLAIMVGGSLLGVAGLLAAVPVTAALAVLLRAGLQELAKGDAT